MMSVTTSSAFADRPGEFAPQNDEGNSNTATSENSNMLMGQGFEKGFPNDPRYGFSVQEQKILNGMIRVQEDRRQTVPPKKGLVDSMSSRTVATEVDSPYDTDGVSVTASIMSGSVDVVRSRLSKEEEAAFLWGEQSGDFEAGSSIMSGYWTSTSAQGSTSVSTTHSGEPSPNSSLRQNPRTTRGFNALSLYSVGEDKEKDADGFPSHPNGEKEDLAKLEADFMAMSNEEWAQFSSKSINNASDIPSTAVSSTATTMIVSTIPVGERSTSSFVKQNSKRLSPVTEKSLDTESTVKSPPASFSSHSLRRYKGSKSSSPPSSKGSTIKSTRSEPSLRSMCSNSSSSRHSTIFTGSSINSRFQRGSPFDSTPGSEIVSNASFKSTGSSKNLTGHPDNGVSPIPKREESMDSFQLARDEMESEERCGDLSVASTVSDLHVYDDTVSTPSTTKSSKKSSGKKKKKSSTSPKRRRVAPTRQVSVGEDAIKPFSSSLSPAPNPQRQNEISPVPSSTLTESTLSSVEEEKKKKRPSSSGKRRSKLGGKQLSMSNLMTTSTRTTAQRATTRPGVSWPPPAPEVVNQQPPSLHTIFEWNKKEGSADDSNLADPPAGVDKVVKSTENPRTGTVDRRKLLKKSLSTTAVSQYNMTPKWPQKRLCNRQLHSQFYRRETDIPDQFAARSTTVVRELPMTPEKMLEIIEPVSMREVLAFNGFDDTLVKQHLDDHCMNYGDILDTESVVSTNESEQGV